MTKTSCPARAPALLSPWRRRCQWAVTLLLLLTPWLHIHGVSLLRVDIPGLTLSFLGQRHQIEELYLVLLFGLALTLAFLLMTMLLGRVWCGWLCPQTTITDLSEWFAKRVGLGRKKPQGKVGAKLLLQLFNLLLACLVSANLLWFFIEPARLFADLISGELHYAAVIFFLCLALFIYLDLALVRRLMCSDFCPYGRFQTTLADQATLTLQLPPAELPRCIMCGACVRACPMGIDIRLGFQIECINCGRCLDACRQVMAKRGQPGLISYSFGTSGKGPRVILNRQTLLLGVATLTVICLLVFAAYRRPMASLKVVVSHTAASRILNLNEQATFFNAWVNNRSAEDETYTITARQTENHQTLGLKGQSERLQLTGGENRRIDFVLITPVMQTKLEVEFILSDLAGHALAVTAAQIRPAEGTKE